MDSSIERQWNSWTAAATLFTEFGWDSNSNRSGFTATESDYFGGGYEGAFWV